MVNSVVHLTIFQIDAHEDDVNAVAFADSSSQLLFSGSDDALCKVWDRRTLREDRPQPWVIWLDTEMESPSYTARYKSTVHTVIFDGIFCQDTVFYTAVTTPCTNLFLIICDHQPDDCEHGTIYTFGSKVWGQYNFVIYFLKKFYAYQGCIYLIKIAVNITI